MINIYVGNVPYTTTEEDLAALFAPYGEIGSTTIIVDRETGRSKGYGFVQVMDDALALKAIEELHGSPFNGRPLTVNAARNSKTKGDGQAETAPGGQGSGDAAAGYSRDPAPAPVPAQKRAPSPTPSETASRGYSNSQRQTQHD